MVVLSHSDVFSSIKGLTFQSYLPVLAVVTLVSAVALSFAYFNSSNAKKAL